MHSLLFVDDEEPLLHAMRDFFVRRGFEVDCATELEEAQALVDFRRYSLVICDISLKGVRDAEGLEVVSYIHGFAPQTKVIILTGSHRPEVRERALEYSVDCVLMKPQPLSDLASTVERLLVEDQACHAQPS